ncbi:hypothetical protein NDN64_05830 [Stenotrophomonas maltophilia]|nr:hypothetical protein [Stenotrophomonas maltophilia]
MDPVTAYQKPVEQFNRYRYANGNPYKFTDPDGRESGAAFKVVNDATNGNRLLLRRKIQAIASDRQLVSR